ncbi:MAG: exodeoxyribonuclease VII large subunit [Acidimicrobiales bacterium]
MARKKKEDNALQFDLGIGTGDLIPGLDRRMEGLQLAREALATGRPPDAAATIEFERSAIPFDRAGAASDSALSIAGFYERLRVALRAEFPEEIWVTGEIRKVTISKGHRYIELADHDPDCEESPRPYGTRTGRAGGSTLEVACWARDWPAIAAALDAVGVELTAGLVVRVRGKVSVWEAGARVRFSLSELDVQSLVGGIAAARRKLLTTLESEGLIDANRARPMPLVPLRIGLVTSAGSEAYRDFTGQLKHSGMAFVTRFEASLVQGPDAPQQIAGALHRLQRAELDLIVLVRGGGAKGDLAAFDHEAVARAIVSSRYPIWTGIGHTGDRSVADEVAHRALVTPTACGEAVVAAVLAYLDSLSSKAQRLVRAGVRAVDQASRDLMSRRSDLSRSGHRQLVSADAALSHGRDRAERSALLAIERCDAVLSGRTSRFAYLAAQHLSAAEQHVRRQRAMLEAFDPRRQLERGWSLTKLADGSIVRSVGAISVEDEVTTMVADGSFVATVLRTEKRTDEQTESMEEHHGN